jgi:hypothetical protein
MLSEYDGANIFEAGFYRRYFFCDNDKCGWTENVKDCKIINNELAAFTCAKCGTTRTGMWQAIYHEFVKDGVMSGAEIAREIDTSPQNVGQSLKSSMGKMFKHIQVRNRHESPYQVAIHLMYVLGINMRGYGEMRKFFKLFPPKLRKKIQLDGKKLNRIKA